MKNDDLDKQGILAHRAFVTVWLGQTLSTFGTQVTGFSLSIWLFHQTGSIVQFGLVIAAQLCPYVILSPLAGALVDRFERRKVMMTCDLLMLITCLPLLYGAGNARLDVQDILILSPFLSIFGMCHNIAYSSSVAQLVPKKLFGTANSLVQVGNNASAVIVPMLAVVILEFMGVSWVLLINVITYIFAIVSLAIVRFPYPVKTAEPARAGLGGIFRQQKFGIHYLRETGNRVLMRLMLFLCLVNFLHGLVQVLFRPMIMVAHSQLVIGWLVTIAGVGGLCGAVFSGALVNKFNKVHLLLLFSYLSGLMAMVCGITTNNYLMAGVVFIFSFSVPIIMVASQTLWQLLVPSEMQGRVFSARMFFSSIVLILTVALAPVLTEYVLEPLMLGDNGFVDIFGPVIGSGPGRGAGLMFALAGILVIFMTYMVGNSRKLKELKRTV